MIKQLLIYIMLFVVLCATSYYLHTVIFTDLATKSPIGLKAVYSFHFLFTLILVILLLILSYKEKFKDQIGFLYLVSMTLKIALFCFVFKAHIFNGNSFTRTESVNLLIPMSLALFFEVLFLSKILNGFQAIKND